MKFKKTSHKHFLSLSNEIGPEDGADPRTFFGQHSRKKTNRKALQMCGEIARTLSSILGWECGDALLQSLAVQSVEPAPDSTRVLVTVSLPAPADPGDVNETLFRLQRMSGKFRTEIATAIHRKRVPELAFRISVVGEVNS